MKSVSKFLALLMALCLLLSLGVSAFAASGEPSGEPSGEASDESVWTAYVDYLYDFLVNVEMPVNTGGMTLEIIENELMPLIREGNFEEGPAVLLFNGMLDSGVAMTYEEFAAQYQPAALSVEDAFIEYIHEWLIAENEINGNMTIEIVEDEYMPLVREFDFVTFPAEMLYNGMLEQGCPMTFEEFAAQYQPASDEPSGEASGEASGEPSGEAAMSVEDAFIEYIHEWLIAEDEINPNMDESIRENEVMPLVREMNFVDFPADMIYNGMLESGVPMTFEEFAAQYKPAASASGDTSEAAYHAYLKAYVDAVPAVDDEGFKVLSALIDANDFVTAPADMLFNAQWWGYAAMTYDEFVAAGGVYTIPAFDPNLKAD